jgi:hypothetical protein
MVGMHVRLSRRRRRVCVVPCVCVVLCVRVCEQKFEKRSACTRRHLLLPSSRFLSLRDRLEISSYYIYC